MQAVLRIAVGLLVVAAFLRLTSDLGPTNTTSTAGPDGGLSILAASKGPLVPMPPLPGGSETLGDVILVGDRILSFDDRRRGLRVAALAPGLVFDAQRVFDLARSERDAEAFLDFTDDRPVGSLLVLLTYNGTVPQQGFTDHLADDLAGRLRELGAETRPLEPAGASWAMITLRRPSGWVKLAEAWSPDQGVSLAFTVGRELAQYDEHRGEVLVSRIEGEALLPLSQELLSATTTGRVVRERWSGVVGGEQRESIACTPLVVDGAPAPSTIVWRDVKLGAGTSFRTGIGLRDGSWSASDGVTFALLVNGAEVHAETLSADPQGWRDWEVDLDAWAGEPVELELCVDPGDGVEGDAALWGAPLLVYRGARGAGSSASGPAETLHSPFNDHELQASGHRRSWSFLVSGSLLQGPGQAGDAERMQATGADFAVGLGPAPAPSDGSPGNLATRLALPVFHPAGNRAMKSSRLHVEGDGSGTIVPMIHGRTLFVFVELAPGAERLCPEQLSFLQLALAGAGATQGIRSVAVFSRKLLWAPDSPELQALLEHTDPSHAYANDGWFERDVLPSLERLAASKPVTWFSGDLVGAEALPLVLHRAETGDLAFVAVGHGDAGNAFVRVDVDAEGSFRFRAVGPGATPARPLESFGIARWKSAAGD